MLINTPISLGELVDKISILIIKEKKFWDRTISELNQNDGDFEMALEIINKYQCIEDTLTRANHFSNVAVDSVDIFKDNIYKEKLVSLVSKSVSRIY